MNHRLEEGAMLVEEIEDDIDAEDLERRYRAGLADIVSTVGIEDAAERTGIDRDRLETIRADGSAFTVTEATAILSLVEDRTPEEIRRDVGDHLKLEMSSAVVDVDAIASALDGDLEPKDYQQMIEGRIAMPLSEYARIYRFVESKNPF